MRTSGNRYTHIDIPGWQTYGEFKRRRWYGCSDAVFLVGDVGCCGSCHFDDEELGISMCWFERDGMEFDVCCKVAGAFRKLRGERY